MKQSFPASFRLKQKADFSALRKGRRLKRGEVSLVYRPNGLSHARLGLAVSRKYGNAVQRNRFKRLFREAMRTSRIRGLGVDILVIPQTTAANMMDISFQAMQAFDMVADQMEVGGKCGS